RMMQVTFMSVLSVTGAVEKSHAAISIPALAAPSLRAALTAPIATPALAAPMTLMAARRPI
ncbi:MAG: hypothetical protein WBL70_01980, partial [Candidatus Acidiferrales bacterium]